jgi:YD repeat-containing protein
MNKRKSILALSLVLVIGIGLLCGCGASGLLPNVSSVLPTPTESERSEVESLSTESTKAESTETESTEAENTESKSAETEQPTEESNADSNGSAKKARLVESIESQFDPDGTLSLVSSSYYDYETGIRTYSYKGSETNDEWINDTYSFTFDDNGIIYEESESSYYEATYWDNGQIKTQTIHLTDTDIFQSFNEYGLVTESYMEIDGSVLYDNNFSHNYLEFEEFNGTSLPTYVYVISTDKDGNSSISYIELSYDSKGNLTQDTYLDNSGQTTSYSQYTYDANSNLVCNEHFDTDANGTLYLSRKYEYTYE